VLRALIFGLTILHLGPGVAFVALAFGCDAVQPLLGAVCQRSPLSVFLGITVSVWTILGAATVAVATLRRHSEPRAP
jgi:hypothetical protein